MNLVFSWLRDFIDLEVSPQELAEKLTDVGIEVSQVQKIGNVPDEVVVAHILERKQHPNADRLSLCRVEDGTQVFSIVCGADNMQTGDKVALAKIGAHLPNGLTIKKSKIRGEVSEGMLCATHELELGDGSEGIMILDADAELGQTLNKHLSLQDFVLDIDITPNRGDCLSVLGIAREAAALGLGTLKFDAIKETCRKKYGFFNHKAESAGKKLFRGS